MTSGCRSGRSLWPWRTGCCCCCCLWRRRHGGRRRRRHLVLLFVFSGRSGRPLAADPEPPPGASSGEPHRGRLPHRPLPLLRDVVWRLPVGPGVLPLLPHPSGAPGPFHPPEAQIRQVHVGHHLPDGHHGTNRRRDLDKCCNCWRLQSCWEGDDPL